MKKYTPYLLLSFLLALAIFLIPDVSFAADNASVIDAGTGLTKFDTAFKTIANGIVSVAKPIVLIMTAIAGCMVVLGMQDGTKTVWNIILGLGLALNFAGFFYNVFGTYFSGDVTTAQISQYQFALKGETDGGIDILSGFMNNYTKNVIVPGAMAIQVPALKILGILTLIEATLQLSLDLISGDKVKFLISICLKAGFYIFLITNWLSGIDLMNSLEGGFQEIGFIAGGAGGDMQLKPDSIVNNAIVIFHAIWDNAHFSLGSIGLTIINLVSLICIMACLFLTAIEMFMARIEFYTMALITIPLLPFGMIKQLNFLSEKAIGAMFNLAIKVCVISFISTVACPFLKSFADKIAATNNPYTQIGIILQSVLAALIIFMLTKKIPELIQGLLSGQPSLGGSGMVQMGMTAMAAAGGAAGAVRAASNMTGGGNNMKASGSGNMMSRMGGTAANLAKLAYTQNPMSKGFQAATGSLQKQVADRTYGNRSEAPADQRLPNPVAFAAKAPIRTAGFAVKQSVRVAKAAMSKIEEYNKGK